MGGFIQFIEMQTSRFDEVEALGKEIRARLDDGSPIGRVDVELDDRGGAIVSWMEFTSDQQADVRVRRLSLYAVHGQHL